MYNNNELTISGQTRKLHNNTYFYIWHDWYIAWKFYTDLVLIIYSHRVSELHGYISILSEFSKDFNLQAVMRYHQDRRSKLAKRRNSSLLNQEPSIQGKHFTIAATRVQYMPKHTFSYNQSPNFRSLSSKTI